MLTAETEPVTERLRVRENDDDEGRRLVRIIRQHDPPVHHLAQQPRLRRTAPAPLSVTANGLAVAHVSDTVA
jgi:hypothetical protein